jgi:chitodextrinase
MAAVIQVSTLSGLYSALANAKGGETIALAGGEYGNLSLISKTGFPLKFPSDVTITSADPGNPAVFARADVRGAQNLTFDGVTFDYTYKAGDPIFLRPFSFSGCEGLTIRNATFDGDVARGLSAVDDGYGYAIGLSVRFSKNVTLEQNDISGFHRGMTVSESQDIAVARNDLHEMRMDGMNFAQVRGVVIAENWIHDFRASLASDDHRDMIQFWTTGTSTATENVVIRGNRLDIGAGDYTQSIFMRNEKVDTGAAGAELFYRNVLIEENVITNAHSHGITVGETAGLTIRQNTVLHADGRVVDGLDGSVEIPVISVAVAATGVTVTGNATAAIRGFTGQPGWTVAQNALVQDQDPMGPGYYGTEFITSSLTPGADPVAVTGGLLDRLGAGADATRDPASDTIQPLFSAASDPDDPSRVIFDATATLETTGALPKGTQFIWSFGDGTTAAGAIVAHDYGATGQYNAQLKVILPNGEGFVAAAPVFVADTDVLTLGDNQFVAFDAAGAAVMLAPDDSITAAGLTLQAKGVSASVAREHVTDILGTEDFSIDMTLQAASSTSRGEIFRLHGSLIASTDAKGNLLIRAFGTDGVERKLFSTDVNLADRKAHDLSIAMQDDVLSLTIDGRVVDTEPMPVSLARVNGHNLVFGNPWGSANFTGTLSAFDIHTGEADFTDGTHSAVLATLDEAMTDAGLFYTPVSEPEGVTLALPQLVPLF